MIGGVLVIIPGFVGYFAAPSRQPLSVVDVVVGFDVSALNCLHLLLFMWLNMYFTLRVCCGPVVFENTLFFILPLHPDAHPYHPAMHLH